MSEQRDFGFREIDVFHLRVSSFEFMTDKCIKLIALQNLAGFWPDHVPSKNQFRVRHILLDVCRETIIKAGAGGGLS